MGAARYLPLYLCVAVVLVLGILIGVVHQNKSPITIGFMGPLTGKYADLGVSGRNGAMLAVEEINSGGGINGHPLVLIPEDDKGTPEGTREAFERLRKANVVAIIGPMLSTNAVALKPLVDEAHLVTISPTVSTSKLSGLKDYFFRVINDNGTRARVLARFAIETLPPPPNSPRLWCLVYDLDNWDYTTDFVNNFSDVVTSYGDLTACHVGYRAGGGVVPHYVFESLEAVKPDAIMLAVSAIDGAQIINHLSTKLPNVPIFAGAWMMTHELVARLSQTNNDIFVEHILPLPLPEKLRNFENLFWKRYGKQLSFPALYTYNAVKILAKAISESDGKTEMLREILSSGISCDCLTGKVHLDQFGDSHHPVWIYKLENGSLRLIKEELPQ